MSPPAPIAPGEAALLAELLSYPGRDVAGRAALAARAAAAASPDAARALSRFAEDAAAAGTAVLEEAYTAAFDLRPATSLCVGALLLGDGPRRNALLAYLAEARAAAGLAPGEVPDHLAEILRLAAADGPDVEELVRLAVAPAATRAAEALARTNPYRALLEAVALRARDAREVSP